MHLHSLFSLNDGCIEPISICSPYKHSTHDTNTYEHMIHNTGDIIRYCVVSLYSTLIEHAANIYTICNNSIKNRIIFYIEVKINLSYYDL